VSDSGDPQVRWCLVVPVKPLGIAKSRLSGPGIDPALRARLALAFAADAVSAALAAAGVVEAVVVTDDPLAASILGELGATVVPDRPDAGLNPALGFGAEVAREKFGDVGVAAMAADLPALLTSELDFALAVVSGTLEESSRYRRHFIADAQDVGTAMLFAPPGVELDPRFGGASRLAHLASGAVEIGAAGIGTLRRDVDTPADLADAVRLGVGPRTSALVARDSATVVP
jgi:2-phospho-L-lactate guanylyltransferase